LTDLVMKDAESFIADVKTDVWAVYIGGAATKVWSDDDIRRISHFPKLPIYVLRPDKSGTFCGLECIMTLYKLGIPRSTAVALDMELLCEDLSKLSESVSEFYKVLSFFGYLVWKYGSLSYIFKVPSVDGSWVATDSGDDEQYQHAGVHATQWKFSTDDGDTDTSRIHRIAVHHRLTESWGINE
jgi:hypothetical protein